jgi:hypothetical protein
MPQPIASSLSTILPLIQQNIAAVTGLPWPERVMITARVKESVPHFQADSDVLIRLMRQRQDFDVNTGQGRVENRWIATCQVAVRSRLYVDEANQDAKFLDDQTLGHIILQDAVTNALEYGFDFLISSTGDSYLTEPLRVTDWTDVERERTDAMWGDSSCEIQIHYIRLLTQNASWAQNC